MHGWVRPNIRSGEVLTECTALEAGTWGLIHWYKKLQTFHLASAETRTLPEAGTAEMNGKQSLPYRSSWQQFGETDRHIVYLTSRLQCAYLEKGNNSTFPIRPAEKEQTIKRVEGDVHRRSQGPQVLALPTTSRDQPL